MTTAKGFTLVELVVVIVLLAILAAIAMARISSVDDFSAPAARQQFINGFSQLQIIGQNQQCAVAMEISASSWQGKLAQDCSVPTACFDNLGDLTHSMPTSSTTVRWVYWQNAWFEAPNSACTDLTALVTPVSPDRAYALSDGVFSLHGWTGYAQ